MDEIKTTTGVVRLIRDGIVLAEKKYSTNKHKDEIISVWKHRYGNKFFQCEVHIQNVPIIQVVYERPPMYRERLRTKVPEYFISNLPNFNINELLKLKDLVDLELVNREINFKAQQPPKTSFLTNSLKKAI